MTTLCPTCATDVLVVDEHEEQQGWEERAVPLIVTNLACGHEIVARTTWDSLRGHIGTPGGEPPC